MRSNPTAEKLRSYGWDCLQWVESGHSQIVLSGLMTARIEEAISAHICEPTNPATFADLFLAVRSNLPAGVLLKDVLAAMVETGRIETFKDEEGGTVYARDC